MLTRRRAVQLMCGSLLGAATGCSARTEPSPRPAPPPPASGAPALRITVVTRGLEHGWGIGFLPDGRVLVSERPARLSLVANTQPDALRTPVRADFSDVLVEGEGGLMGLVLHPDFARNRRFVTCQTHQVDGRAVDVRLVRWELSEDGRSARRLGGPLLTGLPVNPSGRHSGCRPAIAGDGSLLIGTGDAARPGSAQDLGGLGGKVLRLNPDTGAPLPDNPFIDSPAPETRLIYTYGHRNPQGVAPRPGGQVFIAEHGPDEDDEINLLRPGGNYGWDPSRGGARSTYDESVPMTDLRQFPDAVPAAWSSGETTEAVCGAEFLTGRHWGSLDGSLAVTALKGQKVLLFDIAPDGAVRGVSVPPELDHTLGRLRAVRQGPDGALYVTTSNGSDDALLRIATVT